VKGAFALLPCEKKKGGRKGGEKNDPHRPSCYDHEEEAELRLHTITRERGGGKEKEGRRARPLALYVQSREVTSTMTRVVRKKEKGRVTRILRLT